MARRPTSIPDRVLAAAMKLAAERPWREVTLAEIAAAARVDLAQLYEAYASKAAIVTALMRKADSEVVAGFDPSSLDEPVRDRLIDALMRRLDALAPYKNAVGSILRDLGTDPVSALCMLPGFLNSMAWTLEAAGVGSSGLGGRLRVKGLALIYASTVRVWLRDDSPDLGRTMAFLDRRLSQAEHLVRFVPDGRRRRHRETAAEAETAKPE
jgi:AcrR family transcriptional regulator